MQAMTRMVYNLSVSLVTSLSVFRKTRWYSTFRVVSPSHLSIGKPPLPFFVLHPPLIPCCSSFFLVPLMRLATLFIEPSLKLIFSIKCFIIMLSSMRPYFLPLTVRPPYPASAPTEEVDNNYSSSTLMYWECGKEFGNYSRPKAQVNWSLDSVCVCGAVWRSLSVRWVSGQVQGLWVG